MENSLEQLVASLDASPLSTDVLHRIILILEQQTDETLSSFVSQSMNALLILENCAWQLLSQDSHLWITRPHYQELLCTLASFNKKLVYHYGRIEVDTKAALLFPMTIDLINKIFKQIEQTETDDDPFITITGLWFDNYSSFLLDNPQCDNSPLIDHIGQVIVKQYVLSKQYKTYLTRLRHPYVPQSILTAKLLFYMKTCSFYFYSYLYTKARDFPCTLDEIMHYLCEDYLEIIHVHSQVISSWSKELLGCIAQLIGLAAGCCWWDGRQQMQMKILFPTEQIICGHIQDLIRILGHKPFYKLTRATRSNDETVLMDSSLLLIIIIVKTQDINWLFRTNTTVRNTIISVAEAAFNDEICLRSYVILGETLTDDQLKNLPILDNICKFFLLLLEKAWNGTTKKYKQLPIIYLIKAFHTLSKNDSMQQRTADCNKTALFINMCDQYPIVFDILWALSFNQDIQQQLRSSSSFITKLAQLANESHDEQTRKAVHGILWNLEINTRNRPTTSIDDTMSFDIMISYSHKEKSLCKQIYDELIRSGYRVWIDFDHMHGNVMDAMAQAIERSQTIIICMSEQYRRSNYCRAEAHYAFQQQRKLVPVLLQKHYKPDGWLLFLVGQLLYVDFYKYEFNRAMDMLTKELQTVDTSEVSISSPICPKEDTLTPQSIISESIDLPNILDWTSDEVQQWLVEHGLLRMSRLVAGCDGRSLVYLHRYMTQGGSQKALSLLQDDSLRRTNESLSIIELSCFHSLIDQQKRFLQSAAVNQSTKTDMGKRIEKP